MNLHLALELILISFITTSFAIFTLRPFAYKIGLTDKPDSRKRHQGEIPLIGGIAVYISTALLYCATATNGAAFTAASSLILFAGILDDYKNSSVGLRLLIEILAVLIMIRIGGVEIETLGNILGTGEIRLGDYSTVFTVFAVIGGINAFNMLDGIDGLAGGIALGTCTLILGLCIYTHQTDALLLSGILIAATGAFLIFNLRLFGRPSALVYLGDTGSTLLGFSVSWLVVSISQTSPQIVTPATVLWVIAIPLMDTVSIIIRRMLKRKSPFAPDREHLHHIFPVAGYSINQTITIIISLSLILGVAGIIADVVFDLAEWIQFYVFLACFMIYMWGVCRAWKVMKIMRYMREGNKGRRLGVDRRQTNHHIAQDSRSGMERRRLKDRRYMP